MYNFKALVVTLDNRKDGETSVRGLNYAYQMSISSFSRFYYRSLLFVVLVVVTLAR